MRIPSGAQGSLFRLDGAKRFGWGEAGGADCGEESGDCADEDCGGEPAAQAVADDGGPVFEVGVDEGGDGARGDACGAAEQSEQDRFGEELGSDLSLGRAE